MGDIHAPAPVMLLVAVVSRHLAALDWAREKLSAQFGLNAITSDAFEFTETAYYTSTMGTDLKKQFFAFESLIDPGALADIKRQTNALEVAYASLGGHDELRPLNLDPGYITGAKLVLASTKDHAHRIYLRDGIYAEVTLSYRHRQWQPFEWTYPDYRREDFQGFFSQCRQVVLNCGARGDGVK